MSAHTPRPWRYIRCIDNCEPAGTIVGPDDVVVCDIPALPDGSKPANCDADGALIASAPELEAETVKLRAERDLAYKMVIALEGEARRRDAELERVRGALVGCQAALVEAGKDFAIHSPHAARPNLYEMHAETARAAMEAKS